MYCQFCGAKLEEGRQCTCQASQQAAAQQQTTAQSAAPKPVLTQEQKEEMQKMMAQAGESARTAGKALWSSAKVAGKALGSSAKSLAGSAQGALKDGEARKDPALYRKGMLAFGALHVLFFFLLSYAKMDRVNAEVKLFTQVTGVEIPRRLTGLSLLRFMKISAEWSGMSSKAVASAMMWNVILFTLPVLCGVLLIVLNRKAKKNGMIGSVVLSVLTLLSYLLVNAVITSDEMALSFKELGYRTGFGCGFAILVAVLQTAAAVMGHTAAKKAQAAITAAPKE